MGAGHRFQLALRGFFLCLLVLSGGGAAQAHLASDSYLRIEVGIDGRIAGQWDIALRDLDVAVGLDSNQDGNITWGELRARRAEVEAYAFGRLTLAGDGAPCRLVSTDLKVDYHAGSAYAVLPFAADCPNAGRLTLHYRLLFDTDPTHRGLLTVVAGGETGSDVLTPDHAEVALGEALYPLRDQAAQFAAFGFEHILLGYDHLLFVAMLLVTAALRRDGSGQWVPIDGLGRVLIETVKILTAFTVAHAIVLTLAVLGVVWAPERLVAPAVAATIVVTALDNIYPVLPRLRWQVAFLFGLIHGLAFAGALAPMRLPPFRLAIGLGSFNIGIEAGQIALALLLVPIVFCLRREAAYRRFGAPAVSAAGMLLGAWWLIERLSS